MVLGVSNLVKRVRFPVQFISVVSVSVAMVLLVVNLALLLALAAATHALTPTAIPLLIIVLFPLCYFGMSIAWLLSAITFFFRDIAQFAPVGVQRLMFLAPAFYPISAVPADLHWAVALNPLTCFVEALRTVLDGGTDWFAWLQATTVHATGALLARLVFARLRPAFGDLL